MQKAAFSIISYQFDKVNLDLSNRKNNDKNSDLLLGFEPKGIFIKEESKYRLEFTVSVSLKDATSPFLTIRCKGFFKFENVNNLEEIPSFFYKNSIAILFPYVRAYISLVTTQANVPGIILPTLNLSGLEEELKKNTTEK